MRGVCVLFRQDGEFFQGRIGASTEKDFIRVSECGLLDEMDIILTNECQLAVSTFFSQKVAPEKIADLLAQRVIFVYGNSLR